MRFPAFKPIDIKSESKNLQISVLQISQIIQNENQPRKTFDSQSLDELAESIRNHGIIQPIIVRKIQDHKYEIIAGERRWRASCLAGLNEIPSIIYNEDSKDTMTLSLIENIQREELNPIEIAESLHYLNTTKQLSHESIAMMVGKSRTAVTNSIRLLSLSKHSREMLINKKIDVGHAKLLVTFPDNDQTNIVNTIVNKNLTVRQTERYIDGLKKRVISKNSIDKHESMSSKVKSCEKQLTKKLHARVLIKQNCSGKSRVVIDFDSFAELEWFVNKIDQIL